MSRAGLAGPLHSVLGFSSTRLLLPIFNIRGEED